MTDPANLAQFTPSRCASTQRAAQRSAEAAGDELHRALRWAQQIHWFPTVGELHVLIASYRLALARAA